VTSNRKKPQKKEQHFSTSCDSIVKQISDPPEKAGIFPDHVTPSREDPPEKKTFLQLKRILKKREST
jgi:hypothetical protein